MKKNHKRRSISEMTEEDDEHEDFESGQTKQERRRVQNRNAQRTFRAKHKEIRRISKC